MNTQTSSYPTHKIIDLPPPRHRILLLRAGESHNRCNNGKSVGQLDVAYNVPPSITRPRGYHSIYHPLAAPGSIPAATTKDINTETAAPISGTIYSNVGTTQRAGETPDELHSFRQRGHSTHAPDPMTPPQHKAPLYKSIPLPAQVQTRVSVVLNSALQKNSAACLQIDIACSGGIPHEISEQSATIPGIPSLAVVHKSLPWDVVIFAGYRGYITVSDVIEQLRVFMNTPISGRDPSKGCRGRYLQGKSVFVGLSASEVGSETWVLNVARSRL